MVAYVNLILKKMMMMMMMMMTTFGWQTQSGHLCDAMVALMRSTAHVLWACQSNSLASVYILYVVHFYGPPLCNRGTTIIFCFFASSFFYFFQILFLRRLCNDFLETSPHVIDSSAIENIPFTFTSVSLKEIRGQKPHFGDILGHRIKTLQRHSLVRRNF